MEGAVGALVQGEAGQGEVLQRLGDVADGVEPCGALSRPRRAGRGIVAGGWGPGLVNRRPA